MLEFNKRKVVALLFLTSIVLSLTLVNINIPVSAQNENDIYLHSQTPLVPIHKHSNITLKPIHMHGPGLIDLSNPLGIWWHELYPDNCTWWNLTSWEDTGEIPGELDPNDQIDMTNEENETVWYHVDRITVTLLLSGPYGEPVHEPAEPTIAVELKWPYYYPEVIYNPVCTLWHEVWPSYSNVYHLAGWIDDPFNPDGMLSFTDAINLTDINTGAWAWWHVEDVATDLILRWKMMNPISTWWHELYPKYSRWQHLTSWEEPEDFTNWWPNQLSPGDQIDMIDNETMEKNWYFVDRVTITINVTDVEFPDQWMMLELKFWYYDFEYMYSVFKHPVGSLWHEVYPVYSNVYNLTYWDPMDPEFDNCNGVLDPCDYIVLWNLSQPQLEPRLYHIEDMCYDIILNEKITDPVCTFWDALYPEEEYGNEYHIEEWIDNQDGLLSPCDYVNITLLPEGPTERYHVKNVTITLLLQSWLEPGWFMYIEAIVPFKWMYWVKVDPVGGPAEIWHEIWPVYCENYTMTGWEDNCNGVLDYCDNITLWGGGGESYWHVEEVAIDMMVEPAPPPPPPPPLYWKPSYPDYAPSGMPDFDQKQNGTYPWHQENIWSHCAPVAAANSLWWYDSKFENNTTPPPTIIDNYPLVQAYGPWDDHDPQNVQPLVEHLAYLMDTDGIRTGIQHFGTWVPDMQAGIAQYLSWSGVNPLGDVNGDGTVNQTDVDIVNASMGTSPGVIGWNMAADIFPVTLGYPPIADNIIDINDLNLVVAHVGENGAFYEKTVPAPEFPYIEEEIERSEDVLLVLGFWYYDGVEWYREDFPYEYYSGHVVTAAGVNSTSMKIAISDPIQDNAEPPPQGTNGPGRVLPPPPHPHPPAPPDTVHNNATYVSQDIYDVAPVPAPTGSWMLINYSSPQYPQPPAWMAIVEWAVIVSPRGIHDVAVTDINRYKTIVANEGPCGAKTFINVTVANNGDFDENFTVTVKANASIINQTSIFLTKGSNTTITFMWNTTGWKGNYTISATAGPVAGEINTADNTLTDEWIYVAIFCDVDANGKVEAKDIAYVINAYGQTEKKPGWREPNWYVNFDVDCNGKVEAKDIAYTIANFGHKDP